MDDNKAKQILFEKSRKSIGIAYLLWLVLGALGAHRFYSGATGSAIAQLILTLTGVGLLVVIPWLLIDLFLIPGLVNEKNMEIIDAINAEAPREPPQGAIGPELPARIEADLDARRRAMLDDLRQTGYRKPHRERNPLFR